MNRLELAKRFLVEAREALEGFKRTGDEAKKRQACEKGWGAVAQALMHAAGREFYAHREFGNMANELFRKTGDKRFIIWESVGEALHGGGFYHGAFDVDGISLMLDELEEFLKAVELISTRT